LIANQRGYLIAPPNVDPCHNSSDNITTISLDLRLLGDTKPPMHDVHKRISAILIDKLGIHESEITPDASFVKDLGIDSLDYAELVMEFEQTFNIKISDDDAEKLQTIGQTVSYIEAKLKATQESSK
jgi:acyl carrier protein